MRVSRGLEVPLETQMRVGVVLTTPQHHFHTSQTIWKSMAPETNRSLSVWVKWLAGSEPFKYKVEKNHHVYLMKTKYGQHLGKAEISHICIYVQSK